MAERKTDGWNTSIENKAEVYVKNRNEHDTNNTEQLTTSLFFYSCSLPGEMLWRQNVPKISPAPYAWHFVYTVYP
jgi:hypothetical protein